MTPPITEFFELLQSLRAGLHPRSFELSRPGMESLPARHSAGVPHWATFINGPFEMAKFDQFVFLSGTNKMVGLKIF